MKPRIALFLVFGALLALSVPVYGGGIDWITDRDEAMTAGREQGRPICLLIVQDGKRDSDRVVKDFKRSTLSKLLESFVCARVDIEDVPDLEKQFKFRAYPVVIFYNRQGGLVKVIEGKLATGQYKDQMKQVLDKVGGGGAPVRPKIDPSPEDEESSTIEHAKSCPDACDSCSGAAKKAIAYLEEQQQPGGSWNGAGGEADVVATAISGLALLAASDGAPPASVQNARKAVLEAIVDDDGLKKSEFPPHVAAALCGLFLAEFGPSNAPDVRDARDQMLEVLAKAVEAEPDDTDELVHAAAVHASVLIGVSSVIQMGAEINSALTGPAARFLEALDGPIEIDEETLAGVTAFSAYAMRRGGGGQANFEAWLRTYREPEGLVDGHRWFSLLFRSLLANDVHHEYWRAHYQSQKNRLIEEQTEGGKWEELTAPGGESFATASALLFFHLEFSALNVIQISRDAGWKQSASRVELPETRDYVDMPTDRSRVKVFRAEGRYWGQLLVSIDGESNEKYLDQLKENFRQTAVLLWDVTDGQFGLHTVEFRFDKGGWDEADIMIDRKFYEDPNLPIKWAHGLTLVGTDKVVEGGETSEGVRVGEWVKLPYEMRGSEQVINWGSPGGARVMAHELCHYFFGAKDEYDINTGATWCDCLLGTSGPTEMCTDDSHAVKDEASCWKRARTLFKRLRMPDKIDPGPWDAPVPNFSVGGE